MFTIALLANHQDIQAEICEEVRAQALEPQNYKNWPKQFPLLYACIKESLRLYPPAWMIGRSAINDDNIQGYFIPKNSTIIIDLFLLHRQESFFSEPELFKPKRFITDTIEKNTYLPFGGGPRVCIGQHFSMLEMISIFHHILSNFRLESVQSKIVCEPLVTLTPKYPIIIRAIAG
jgi:cytochrome P450